MKAIKACLFAGILLSAATSFSSLASAQTYDQCLHQPRAVGYRYCLIAVNKGYSICKLSGRFVYCAIQYNRGKDTCRKRHCTISAPVRPAG